MGSESSELARKLKLLYDETSVDYDRSVLSYHFEHSECVSDSSSPVGDHAQRITECYNIDRAYSQMQQLLALNTKILQILLCFVLPAAGIPTHFSSQASPSTTVTNESQPLAVTLF